jgi:hypothetical protein
VSLSYAVINSRLCANIACEASNSDTRASENAQFLRLRRGGSECVLTGGVRSAASVYRSVVNETLAKSGVVSVRLGYYQNQVLLITTTSAYESALSAGRPSGSVCDPNTWNWSYLPNLIQQEGPGCVLTQGCAKRAAGIALTAPNRPFCGLDHL